MKRPFKAAVIGAGGIACQLLPALSRLMHCVIVDKDIYEKENVSRQFPALTQDGNKAEVLSRMLQPNTLFHITAIPEYLEGLSILNEPLFDEVDLLIGAVDNVESRHIIMDLALTMGVPAFLGGNEHEHGEAHAFYGGVYDPRNFHSFEGGDPAPFHCGHDKTLEEFPQTSTANFLAAASIMHLLSSYEKVQDLKNAVAYSRIDPLGSRFARVRDYENPKGL